VVLIADSILARSTRRRQTATGWNTAYIGAHRYTLPPAEKPPTDDALYPMAFSVEKLPGAVTRPHFHQAGQFQVAFTPSASANRGQRLRTPTALQRTLFAVVTRRVSAAGARR